jgi:chromate transporter
MRLQTLALRFLKIGATGFGGPMALIGMMHRDLVERGQEVQEETFGEGMALAQMLPGPDAVDCATHIGFRLRGFLGATIATVALVMPAFLVMLVVSPLYLRYGQIPQATGFFKGVGPAVVAIILAASWRMGRKVVSDWRAGLVAAVVFSGALLHIHPALLVIAAGVAGMVIGPRPRPERPNA